MSQSVAMGRVCVRWREVDSDTSFELWTRDLSDAERRTAERFKFEEDRGSYVVAHGLVRRALSEVMPSVAPSNWIFTLRDDGKPEIARSLARDLDFSISHTRGFAVCAIARVAVGVDVEAVDCAPDLPLLANRLFAPSEARLLETAPVSERRRTFIRLWTLKEAYLKATGEGLRLPLDQVVCAFRPEPELILKGRPCAADDWSCAELNTYPGFQVAIVCQLSSMVIEVRRDDGPST